ncbi:MAG: hypothetical protein Aureis2KO_08660 [Aureisphaera sp.]
MARLDSLLQSEPLNAQDNRGRTLLHWAVACRRPQVFQYLIEKGIDIHTEDNEGATAMYMAVRFKSDTLFDALAQLQTNTSWKTKYGAKFMERAILDGNLDFVQKLVTDGVDINGVNDRGSSPLEIAKRIKADSIYDWLVSNGASIRGIRRFKLYGDLIGQAPPGKTPQVFAPNFISTEEYEFGSVFNAAGDEFYYGVDVGGRSEIRFTQRVNNQWSQPITLLSHDRYGYNDPFLSPDEQRLYFISKRAMDGEGELKDHDIWYVQRENDSWSQPINAGSNINSEGNEYYISFTDGGTMYFASNKNAPEERRQSDQDIYYSTYINGKFQEAVALSDAVNTEHYEADVFVAPDESYIIFCSMRPEGLGRGDLYISFKNQDGSWTPSVSMGPSINTIHHELCPYVTLDGRYLFYTSNQDIYWVDAQVIEDLRPKKGE